MFRYAAALAILLSPATAHADCDIVGGKVECDVPIGGGIGGIDTHTVPPGNTRIEALSQQVETLSQQLLQANIIPGARQ